MIQAFLHGHAWSASSVAADLVRYNLADVDLLDERGRTSA
jgi:hypothetical protein